LRYRSGKSPGNSPEPTSRPPWKHAIGFRPHPEALPSPPGKKFDSSFRDPFESPDGMHQEQPVRADWDRNDFCPGWKEARRDHRKVVEKFSRGTNQTCYPMSAPGSDFQTLPRSISRGRADASCNAGLVSRKCFFFD